MISLDEIERRLRVHRPARDVSIADLREAAVAIILREPCPPPAPAASDSPEILFIRRAERRGDPWSGHMAFPGGHRDRGDATLVDAAIRETAEEVGLDLTRLGRHIGALAPIRAMPRSRRTGTLVAPFVFRLTAQCELQPNYEVAEALWTPLAPLLRGELHSEREHVIEGASTPFRGYRLTDANFVWGLTYRMLHMLFDVVHPDWQPPR